ncbi:MAG TPA: NDP-sugar synthase [Bryobacteraceae bacterium]|nr:NDP-sugar synthase [Bryobacteraceae bacterium]
MKAMVLAAGKGTRVRPITNLLPKPMIPLIGKPIMQSIVEHLRDSGFDQIMVNTSHLASQIEEYFGDGFNFGVEMGYSFEGLLKSGRIEGQAVGSAGGMKKIQEFSGFFDDTFLVLCGDALVNVDLREAVRFHRKRGAIATIILRDVPRDEVFRYGVVATDPDGRITRFQEKPKVEDAVSTTINTGIYLFEPSVFDYIPSGVPFDIGSELFPALVAAGAPMYGVNLPFDWVDIGSVPDYWDATRLAMESGIPGYRLPGREVLPGVRVGINVGWDPSSVTIRGPVVIGSSTHIGAGAVIEGPTVIGSGCVIEPGAVVRECILGNYTRVTSVARLNRVLIFGPNCINPDGTYLDVEEARIGWVVDDARKSQAFSDEEMELRSLAACVA